MKRLLYFLYLLPIFLSLGCNKYQDEISIKLSHVKGYGPFLNGNLITFPAVDSIYYKGVPNDLDEYVVRSVILQRKQYLWNQYKTGKIDKQRFSQLATYYKIDSTRLTNELVDSEVIFLIGTRTDKKRIIIVDSNNDENFSGEKILEYDFPLSLEKEKEISDFLPVISANYEYFEEGKITRKTVNLQPSPYRGSLGISYYTKNEVEKKYDLFISFPEYLSGKAKINHSNYDVYVSNGFASMVFTEDRANIYIKNNKDTRPSEIDGDLPYRIGDIFNTDDSIDYLIEKISFWGDTLNLKYLGKNSHPFGFNEMFYIPKFTAQKLDHSEFSLKDYSGKYILFDFWGTWCTPCIKSIPDLKELYNEFKDKEIMFVSVAFDSDANKVGQFVLREQMNWEHIFIDQNKIDKNSLVEKLRVSSFPTTILISPEGVIIARNKSFEELRIILNEKLKSQHLHPVLN